MMQSCAACGCQGIAKGVSRCPQCGAELEEDGMPNIITGVGPVNYLAAPGEVGYVEPVEAAGPVAAAEVAPEAAPEPEPVVAEPEPEPEPEPVVVPDPTAEAGSTPPPSSPEPSEAPSDPEPDPVPELKRAPAPDDAEAAGG